MRAGVINSAIMSCQPLRFGKSESKKTVDELKQENAALRIKFKKACEIAALQADQFECAAKNKKS